MMTARTDLASQASHFLHRHLLKLIVLSYLLAAAVPALGLWIKDAAIVDLATASGRVTMTIPKLLLALLLFNAGLRAKLGRVGGIVRRPGMMLAGLAANLAVPLLFLALMVPALRAWHNPDEAAVVLVGLALVTAMPIAGSSTGWAQAADGDMALSLGLVLGSTLLSPLTTPASLHALGAIAPGHYGTDLHRLAGSDTGAFLAAWVLLPSLLGMAARLLLGEDRAGGAEKRLRIVAPHHAACVVLRQCLGMPAQGPGPSRLGLPGNRPDVRRRALHLNVRRRILVSRMVGADRGQRAALMFGLGMNNNGTGLVLASLVLGSQPLAMLPIIVYNLTQHLIAGCVDAVLRRTATA